uniref:Ribosome-binding factor A n=1 Tax=Arundo donax TaxID=35708 RepID=A0A0A9U5Q3_ARUDO
MNHHQPLQFHSGKYTVQHSESLWEEAVSTCRRLNHHNAHKRPRWIRSIKEQCIFRTEGLLSSKSPREAQMEVHV